MSDLTGDCERCKRPARLRALYGRKGGEAILMGRYGPACFYKVAALIGRAGFQPETESTRVIWLRGTK